MAVGVPGLVARDQRAAGSGETLEVEGEEVVLPSAAVLDLDCAGHQVGVVVGLRPLKPDLPVDGAHPAPLIQIGVVDVQSPCRYVRGPRLASCVQRRMPA